MSFTGQSLTDSLSRDEYPQELKKVLQILERSAGGRGHNNTDMWTVRCIRMLEHFYKKHIGCQKNESTNLSTQVDQLKTQIAQKNQEIERRAANYAELEKRVGDFPQACAALEKQLKFATDRIERADEEKKELQEVLRAWEAENLRLRTQVVKLMEQQVKSAALEAQAHQTDMNWQKERAGLRRQLKGSNKQNVQRRLHLTNSHKSLREEKRLWLEEREIILNQAGEHGEELTQLELQLAQLEDEHRALLVSKDGVDSNNIQLQQQLAESEAEAAVQRSEAIQARKQGHENLMQERDEWRLKCDGIPMAKERKEELLVTNRNLRAERDEVGAQHQALLTKYKKKEKELAGLQARNSQVHTLHEARQTEQRHIEMDVGHLQQANSDLVQQIRVAHDSEERALNAKAVVEEERDSLLRQVVEMETERVSRRTKQANERQHLLKQVAAHKSAHPDPNNWRD